ncbi:phosphotransferase family protein [Burkholderia ubonensis]|uniref:phosphotransferase family protein n=1 Tax=Burkholderia ubonensis TaxID=101571 RepID=UPI000A650D3F|nr:aminoglycoside phosphotransferase family protein [Burkholderia ubonensis]
MTMPSPTAARIVSAPPEPLRGDAIPPALDSYAALTRYLIARGLLAPASVVDGGFRMRDLSRRNQNLLVDGAGQGGLFVKIGTDRAHRAGLAHEAAVYRLLRSMLEPAHAERLLPVLVDHDPHAAVLVLGQVDRENLRDLHARLGRFVPALAARLGRELGRLHRALPRETWCGHDGVRGIEEGGFYPLPFCLVTPMLGFVANCSAASLALLRLVQGNARLCAMLEALEATWRAHCADAPCLIHADLRLDNCCVHLRPLRLRIVDWELATDGDPAWDAGAVMADYVSAWLHSMPLPAGAEPSDCVPLAGIGHAALQDAMRAFFTAYAAARGLAGSWRTNELHACVRYAAARLLQLAYEQLQGAAQLTTHALGHVQLCENLLRRPEEGAAHFLGLPP